MEARTAIIVGGASGMGAATARVLAREGYQIVLGDRDRTGVEKIASETGARGLAVDVTDEVAVARFFDEAVAALGSRLDALAIPAGITDATPFFDLTVERWREIQDVNVLGTFLCIREGAKRMQRGGRIVTVSSVAGKRGGGLFGTAAYSASKGAVLALTRNAARVLADRGIAVNCLVPGATATPMIAQALADPEKRPLIVDSNYLHRAADPSELAEAIAWLLSPKASFVVGESLTVDGGVMFD